MRILHVHSGNIFGGVERILVALARHRLYNSNFEHEFALCFRDRLLEELNAFGWIPVHLLPEIRISNPLLLARNHRALHEILAMRKFDLAIVHSAWGQIAFGGGIREANLPLLLWLHTNTRADSPLERIAQLHFPDAIISVSHSVNASAPRLFPGVPSHVVYAPLPIDRPAFDRTDRLDRDGLRASLGAEKGSVVILQASRLEAWKGHANLIAALAKLRRVSNWNCWIAGGPRDAEEANYLEDLRTQSHAAGISDRIQFLGNRKDIPDLLIASDIYCQANTEPEGFSIAFLEAAYAARPIVTTRLGGAVEIVDESTGILVPPGDTVTLADALGFLIEDPDTRNRLGRGAQTRVIKLCDPKQQFAALEKVFTETIARHV